MVKVGKLRDDQYDITMLASFQKDGLPSFTPIKKTNYPVKNAPDYVTFEDMMRDILDIECDAYIDINTGVTGESVWKFLPENYLDRFLDEGFAKR